MRVALAGDHAGFVLKERLRAHLASRGHEVVDGWETAYYTDFSGSSGKGPRPLVVSYATSPAAEVFYADPKPADSPNDASPHSRPPTPCGHGPTISVFGDFCNALRAAKLRTAPGPK